MARVRECPVEAYARDVAEGRIVVGRLVRLACERHLRDLATGHERGLRWDAAAAARVIRFFACLRLPDADRPFVLQPWQAFIVGSLFGWKAEDGYRRFRTAYVEVGKGNGKSPIAAGIGLYMLMADEEEAAEVYSAATTRDQASILFRDAKNIVDASAALLKHLDPQQYNIAHHASRSFFRPVSSESRGLDGKRVHAALIDEVHEHPTALVVDKMRAGTKGRNQALIFEITNSGYDRNSVCWHHHTFSTDVLTEIVENDSWFAYVCGLDPCEACRAAGKDQPTDGCSECDDWQDEAVWLKANPNLGVSIQPKYLREQVAEAAAMPTKANIVKRLNLCLWTESAVHAIPMDKWDACPKPGLPRDDARLCWAGLDIGATSDFTALVLMIPHDDVETVQVTADPGNPNAPRLPRVRRSFTMRPTFWLPKEPIRRAPQVQAVIDAWKHGDHIRETEGQVVDYEQVMEDLLAILAPYQLVKFAFDRGFQGASMGTMLLNHFGDKVVSYPQGIISMNAPFRELIELVIMGRLFHDGNPVMRWMAANCAAETRGGLMKPSKEHSKEKIDGVTAAVMALGVAMQEQGPARSVYEDRGFVIL